MTERTDTQPSAFAPTLPELRAPETDKPAGPLQCEPLVRVALQEVQRRERLFALLTLLVAALGLAAFALLFLLVLDGLLLLPQHSRQSALRLLVWGLGSVMALGTTWQLLRRRTPRRTARRIEAALPRFGNSLITYVELIQKRAPSEADAELAQLIGDRLHKDIPAVDIDRVIPLNRLRQAGLFVAAMLLGLAVYAGFHRATFGVRLGRVLFPALHNRPPTATYVWQVEPGNTPVLRGEAVSFTAHLHGEPTDDVTLHYRSPGGVEQQLPMRQHGTRTWKARLSGLADALAYHVTAGDGRSKDYRLTVVDRPAVVELRAHIEPPAHAQVAPVTVPGGNLRVLAGSVVELEAETNVPVGEDPPPVVRIGNRELPMRVDASTGDRRLRVQLPVLEALRYSIVFADRAGHMNDGRLEYRIDVRPDEAPHVVIPRPGHDVTLPPDGRLPLRVLAEDDVGLSAVALHLQVDIGRWETRALRTLEGDRVADVPYLLDLAPLQLAEGQQISYYASCTDNRPSEMQTAESQRYTITIAAPEPPPSAAPDAPKDRPAEHAAAATPEQADIRTFLQNLTRHADAAADQGLSETDRKALADLARQAAAAAQSMADTEAAAGNGDAAAGEGQPSGGAQAEGQAGDSDGGAGDGGARPDASASTGRRVIDPSSDGGRDDAIVDGSPDASRTERRDGAEGSDPAPGGGEDKDRKQTPEDLAGRLRDAADALQNGASARDVLDRLQQDMPEEALAFTPTARMVGPAGADWQAMPPADVDAVAPSETRSAAGDHAAGDDVTPQQADHIVREWQQRLDPEYQAVFEAYWKALGEQSPEE